MSEPNLDDKEKNRPDPEVPAKPRRRKFTAEYKLRIVNEADELKSRGEEVGALLRREGLYSSHLSEWRSAIKQGTLTALGSKKRGRKPSPESESKKALRRLERENERLRRRLQQAELVIDVQKKVSLLLGLGLDRKDEST